MNLEDFEYLVRKCRVEIRRFAEDNSGLCCLSEAHLDAALAALDSAQANIELATLHQAQALAGAR